MDKSCHSQRPCEARMTLEEGCRPPLYGRLLSAWHRSLSLSTCTDKAHQLCYGGFVTVRPTAVSAAAR